MREIEFRGLRTDGNGWVYGYYFEQSLAYGSYSTIYSPGNRAEEIDSETVHVIRETVGQFTGLHDKHGNKIWEGDVILCVDYGQQANGIIVADLIRSGYMVKWLSKTDFNDCIYVRLDSITIIGNIHEHPHLIK